MRNEVLNDYLFAKAYEKELPISASLEMLDACNLRCEHCYLPEHINSGLTTEQVKYIIDDMKKVGVFTVTLTGGEIFTRKDIFEIIKYIRNKNMRVVLLTNATLLNEIKILQLKELNIAQLSTTVFSMNPQIHDSITGIKGSWKMVMKNLELLKKHEINVQVKTPLMKKNKYDYREIGEYCNEKGFVYRFGARIFKKNDGDESPQILKVPFSDLGDIIRDYDENEGKNLFDKDITCGALRYNFSVDMRGNVYPCVSYPICVGNVFDDTMETIWNSQLYRNIRNIKKSEVEECKNCELKSYCKRCPAMAYRDKGNFYACDEDAKKWAVCRREKCGL